MPPMQDEEVSDEYSGKGHHPIHISETAAHMDKAQSLRTMVGIEVQSSSGPSLAL